MCVKATDDPGAGSDLTSPRLERLVEGLAMHSIMHAQDDASMKQRQAHRDVQEPREVGVGPVRKESKRHDDHGCVRDEVRDRLVDLVLHDPVNGQVRHLENVLLALAVHLHRTFDAVLGGRVPLGQDILQSLAIRDALALLHVWTTHTGHTPLVISLKSAVFCATVLVHADLAAHAAIFSSQCPC